MIAYCDMSALLKVVVAEADSERVVRWLSTADQVGCSCIGLVEGCAALARRQRQGHLTVEGLDAAVRLLRAVWDTVAVVDVDVERAAGMAMTHELRSLDALHLAAALSLSEMLAPVPVVLATFDHRLARAAVAVGLAVWPEADGSDVGRAPGPARSRGSVTSIDDERLPRG